MFTQELPRHRAQNASSAHWHDVEVFEPADPTSIAVVAVERSLKEALDLCTRLQTLNRSVSAPANARDAVEVRDSGATEGAECFHEAIKERGDLVAQCLTTHRCSSLSSRTR